MNRFSFLFFAILAALYWYVGWQILTVLIAFFSGFLITKHNTSLCFFFGVLVHGAALALSYYLYPNYTTSMMPEASQLLGGVPEAFLPTFTILIPSSVYALAGYFSAHLTFIIRKLYS